jgi:diguanylate cyclase (GGDEF)-like protein
MASETLCGSQARRILVADDDEHTRNLLRDVCEGLGHVVDLAASGDEVLSAISRTLPDLLLLDLMMPGRDGFSVLKEIRNADASRDLPVIILSALEDMEGKIRGMELGASDWLTKPFRLSELQSRIGSVLAKKTSEHASPARAESPESEPGYSQLKTTLEGEVSRSRRYGRPAAALVLGIEDSSRVRHSLGREKYEEFWSRLKHDIRTSLRGADRLFRLQVDQLVLLLPETDVEGSKIAAERLCRLVESLRPNGRSGEVEIRARIGSAVYPSDAVRSSEDLLREANRLFRAGAS